MAFRFWRNNAVADPALVERLRTHVDRLAGLMITDTSFLRNPHYHSSTDTPDTLDYERLARATLGVAGGIARLAGCKGRILPR